MTTAITFGRQLCGSPDASSSREWLVTDGLGGFAMGTVGGLSTRRYHGLLVVATAPPIGRQLGLASLDPMLVMGDQRIRLATHEWADGTVEPAGHRHLARFDLVDGVPRWQWEVDGIVLVAEVAMEHGRPSVAARWTAARVGARAQVRLEVETLCTWRDVHGERFGNGDPGVAKTADGFVFEDAYRVHGPGFEPDGQWYRGVRHREEAARGLNATEDLWFGGRFTADLAVGDALEVEAWAGDLASLPPAASITIDAARRRARACADRAKADDSVDGLLAHAADQFVVEGSAGPTVVAGYPWFGDWSRDTMTSYEGLLLDTGRADDGAALLRAAASTVSEGMLANTADAGGTEFNTADGSLWFLHAVGRHVERTGDTDLGRALLPTLEDIVEHHVAGTRFGIRVDRDGLLTQGADGWALTWMDARVDGAPITARAGKPVEVNALWINGLRSTAAVAAVVGGDTSRVDRLADSATTAFRARFARSDGAGLLDVVDPDDPTVRPNQLLAVSLPYAPLDDPRPVLAAVEPLVTSIGLRSLAPDDPRFLGRHRGDSAARDRAYHQGTVWPWLVGPWVDAQLRLGPVDPRVLDGLTAHLAEWGLGSVSETADGDAPLVATGCRFQAWSVAELLRARRRVRS